jgi:3-deoxy-D-manno-octulosonic-acid transferase
MYNVYRIISFLVYPFIYILLLWRVLRGKENGTRYTEKLGYYKISRPKEKLIWFHAASIGEFNAMLPVINSISEEYPNISLLVTTVTVTAANIAKHNLPENAIHQYAPLDCINIAKRFIDYWQPNLVIWTESELWPNLLKLCNKRSQLLLINARMSKKSFDKWYTYKSLATFVLNNFSLILAQSKETKKFLESLGAKNVIYAGNLKFVAANFAFDEPEANKIKKQIKNRLVIMAASTHPGEEEMFALLHRNLKQKYPNILTIIAPRHPVRTDEILKLLKKLKLNTVTRSSKAKIENDVDIFLTDTVGEFGLFYHLTEIVCTGGSWSKVGHSFIEPAKLKNLIIFGPNMQNSREVADEFLLRKAALTAANGIELEKIMLEYIEDSKKFDMLKSNGEKIVDEMNQVKEKVLKKIRPYVDIL